MSLIFCVELIFEKYNSSYMFDSCIQSLKLLTSPHLPWKVWFNNISQIGLFLVWKNSWNTLLLNYITFNYITNFITIFFNFTSPFEILLVNSNYLALPEKNIRTIKPECYCHETGLILIHVCAIANIWSIFWIPNKNIFNAQRKVEVKTNPITSDWCNSLINRFVQKVNSHYIDMKMQMKFTFKRYNTRFNLKPLRGAVPGANLITLLGAYLNP